MELLLQTSCKEGLRCRQENSGKLWLGINFEDVNCISECLHHHGISTPMMEAVSV